MRTVKKTRWKYVKLPEGIVIFLLDIPLDPIISQWKSSLNHHKIPLNHHKIPLNHHKIQLNHHKIPLNHHKTPLNHHKIPLNHHKIPLNHHYIPKFDQIHGDLHSIQPAEETKRGLLSVRTPRGPCEPWKNGMIPDGEYPLVSWDFMVHLMGFYGDLMAFLWWLNGILMGYTLW